MQPPGSATDPAIQEKRQFIIRSCLGRGGFGEVYRASMTAANGLETDVAVKVLHTDLDTDAQSVQRLRDEGKMLGALVHPAIVRVYDLVMLEGRIGLVTEYVEGQDLADCLRADPPMPARAIAAVVGRIADALRAAWETPAPHAGDPLHLIHRDIKPQNIRIGRQGDVKLLDFGVARSSNVGREAHTNTGHMVGSYLYMAPECLLENQFGRESDIFALGATMYECHAHSRLFKDLSLRELYVLVLQDDTYRAHIEERLGSLDAPPPVVNLMRRMLARNAIDRPSAAEISSLCDDLVDSLPGPTLRRWCKQHDWPEPNLVAGLLDGRTITEATMATTMRPDFVRDIPAGKRRRRLDIGVVFGTLATLGMVAGLVIGLLGLVIALVAVVTGSSGGSVGIVRDARAFPIETADVGTLRVAPRTVMQDRSPRPEPAQASTQTSRLFIRTGTTRVPVNLVGSNGRRYHSGGALPYGRYRVEAKWEEGFERIPGLTVDARGPTTTLTCTPFTRSCSQN
jgi:hypothetical protein